MRKNESGPGKNNEESEKTKQNKNGRGKKAGGLDAKIRAVK